MMDNFSLLLGAKLSGGGGSSNYSTASLTIDRGIYMTNVGAFVPIIENGMAAGYVNANANPRTVTVILYGGSAKLYLPISAKNYTGATTGNISPVPGTTYLTYTITGDCTFSIIESAE